MNPISQTSDEHSAAETTPISVPAGAQIRSIDGRRVVTFPVHVEVVVDSLDAKSDEEALLCVAERLDELGLDVSLGEVPLAHVIEKIP